MIKTEKIMKKLVIFLNVMLLAGFMLTVSCSDSNSDNSLFGEEKSGLEHDLDNLSESLTEVGNDIEDRLDINQGPIESGLEDAQNEFERLKFELEEAYEDLGHSSESSWDKMKDDLERTRMKIEQDLEALKNDLQS